MAQQSFDDAVEAFRSRLGDIDRSGQSASRKRILEAYLQLALAHGFNSVTMRMMARVLDIKAPSLYAHFPDGRDEIVAESLRWHFHIFGSAVLEALAECDGSASASWSALVEVHVVRQVELPQNNMWDLLIATDRMVGVLPAELRAEVEELNNAYEQLFCSAAAEMGFDDNEQAVRLVMTLLEGASRWCTPTTSAPIARCVLEADRLSRLMLTATGSRGETVAGVGAVGASAL